MQEIQEFLLLILAKWTKINKKQQKKCRLQEKRLLMTQDTISGNGQRWAGGQICAHRNRAHRTPAERTHHRAHIRIETERAGRRACAKARVIRSTAAQLRYALRYAFPKNCKLFGDPNSRKAADARVE